MSAADGRVTERILARATIIQNNLSERSTTRRSRGKGGVTKEESLLKVVS